MSRYTASRVAADVDRTPLLMRPLFSKDTSSWFGLDATLHSLYLAELKTEQQAALDRRAETYSAYGYDAPASMPDKPFCFVGGAALIPIHGMLINRFPYSWGFATGYNFIRDQLSAALADEDVKLIVFDVNSPGGTVAGCQETADAIFAARGKKSTLAVVDSSCYSAAYYLASQADRIVATPSAGLGSIGIIMMRVDFSGALAQEGVKVALIHAGAYKTDGWPYEPMSDAEQARYQESVDSAYDSFVSTVARGRGMAEDDVRATEAGTFNATSALQNKLCDAIVTPAAAVRDALCPPDDESEQEDDTQMADPNAVYTEEQYQAAIASASASTSAKDRADEKARVAGILACDEAKDRPALASHLALETDMSLDAAKALLGKAASEKPQARSGDDTSDVLRFFDNHGGAGVTQGTGGAAGGDEIAQQVETILGLQSRFSGRQIAKREAAH